MSDAFITALGPVNPSWQRTTIADLAVYVGSGVTPTGGSDVYTTSGVTFIRSQNVTNEGLLLDDVAFIDEHTHERMSGSAVAPFDVLLNITGASIGRCCFLPSGLGPTNVNQHVCAIRLPAADEGDAKFLSSVLSSPIGQNQIFRLNAGGNREGLNYQQLRRFQIPWPAQAQRSKIARILTTLDNVIAQTEALIAKYQAIKQGLMHDLFTRGVDATGKLRPPQSEAPELYKQSDLGRIPKEWEVCQLGDCVDSLIDGPFGSNLKTEHYVTEPCVRVVRLQNISDSGYDDSDPAFISYGHANFLSRHKVIGGDVLIASLGDENYPPGRSCLYPSQLPPAVNKADCFRLRCKSGIAINAFVSYALNSSFVRQGVKRFTQGVTLVRVNGTNIKKVWIKVPSVDEQQQIVDRLDAVHAIIETQADIREKYQLQKTGLMQDLLTGKVPVKADEPEEINS